jgi:hypothetical protein
MPCMLFNDATSNTHTAGTLDESHVQSPMLIQRSIWGAVAWPHTADRFSTWVTMLPYDLAKSFPVFMGQVSAPSTETTDVFYLVFDLETTFRNRLSEYLPVVQVTRVHIRSGWYTMHG